MNIDVIYEKTLIESFLDDHSFYKHVYDVYQKVKEHKCAFKFEPFIIIMEDNVFNRRKFIFLGCVIITIPERFNIENVLLPIVNSKKRVTPSFYNDVFSFNKFNFVKSDDDKLEDYFKYLTNIDDSSPYIKMKFNESLIGQKVMFGDE